MSHECPRCGRTTHEDFINCHECRRVLTEANRRRRAEKERLGLCRCGRLARAGFRECTECAATRWAQQQEIRRANREAGLCSCGRERHPGRSRCDLCRSRQRESDRLRYLRRKS